MKKTILILSMLLLVTIQLNAKVWRLNNTGADADFTTLQAAHNNSYVLAGDTLHLEASSGSYGDLTATKPLVIIGAGYFLSENADMQANLNSSKTGLITFNAGSEGSIIAGCECDIITIVTNNIIIEKNYIHGSRAIILSGNISNIIIRQNYLIGGDVWNQTDAAIYCYRSICNNCFIYNNFIDMPDNFYCIYVENGFSGNIFNNVLGKKISICNSVFNNNIMVSGTFTQSNCTYTHNIGNLTQFGSENGNQQNINMEDVFVGATRNSSDGQWQLKSGSPAIGAGVGGIDCGMFGGDFPYHLSGLPSIPAIYYHQQTIDNVNQQLNITIKAKSHN